MRLRALLVPVALTLSLALAACGGDDAGDTGGATAAETGSETTPGGAAARSEKVEIVEFAYQPDPVVVAVGGKVIWKNEDSAPHTASADDGSFDTGTLDKGKLKSVTFKDAGSFPYFCEIHPTMHGTVEVVD